MRFLLLFAITSCAVLNPEPLSTYYYSDTTKREGYDCSPKFESKEIVETSVRMMTEAEKKGFEEYTGYSECKHTILSKGTYLVDCKKPTSYKRITTTSAAMCDKFMNDNKLK